MLEPTLADGKARSQAAPGSAASIRTEVLGSPAFGDIDGEGDADAVMWLSHETGGSGAFYYVAAAMNECGGFRGTTGYFAGDRIAPRDIVIGHRAAKLRFADRKPSTSFAERPKDEVIIHLILTTDGLVVDRPVSGLHSIAEFDKWNFVAPI